MAIKGFGIPKQRQTKVEMFPDTPVVTMLKWEGKGHVNKFEFNIRALELLGTTPGIHSVNFAFDDETGLAYIGKDNGEGSVVMAKNKSISNKKFYDYIMKNYGLDNSTDNYMGLTSPISLTEDVVVYKLTPVAASTEEVETPTPVKDKEIEHLVDEDGVDNTAEEEVLMATGPHDPNFNKY